MYCYNLSVVSTQLNRIPYTVSAWGIVIQQLDRVGLADGLVRASVLFLQALPINGALHLR